MYVGTIGRQWAYALLISGSAVGACTTVGEPAAEAEREADATGNSEVLASDPDWENTCTSADLQPGAQKAELPALAYWSLLQEGLFVKEADIMTVSYHEGYNLNFEITQEEAQSLLPCNMRAVPMRLLESDTEPLYYLSLYMAVLDAGTSAIESTRIDLFTYGVDEAGDLSLHFVSSYMGLPDSVRDNEALLGLFEDIFDFFARDSRTNEPAYPHYYADVLQITSEGFRLVYGDSTLEAQDCRVVTKGERFSADFVNANSQISRTPIDKNVNYFNQSFIKASVQTRDPACVRATNLQGFHPMLRELTSIQFYGSPDKKITWYYEMCSAGVCGNPTK